MRVSVTLSNKKLLCRVTEGSCETITVVFKLDRRSESVDSNLDQIEQRCLRIQKLEYGVTSWSSGRREVTGGEDERRAEDFGVCGSRCRTAKSHRRRSVVRLTAG